jgi:hypothetical protein
LTGRQERELVKEFKRVRKEKEEKQVDEQNQFDLMAQ